MEGFDKLIEYMPNLMEGAVVTVTVAFASLAIALVLGLGAAMMKLSKSRASRSVATTYTTVIRGVPDLVLMLLIFFGGQIQVNNIGAYFEWDYIDVDAFTAGVLTIGFIFGAYMGETFRGAILSVPVGLLEAGYAYGMSKWQVFYRILVPQMMRHALPGLGNNWLVLMKTTALVSIIGLHDIVLKAGQAGGSTRLPFIFYLFVAFAFLVFTTVSIWLLNWLNRRYSVGVRRA
ncbi:ABC transporter permease [Pelagibius litoralis]|uniref:ABC transporter permease n=1 Tax=Pelagibius litoralis TaxID=374515 RepID=A0A967F300_9PROT|nr:ABC transporter permease [Pelagibius litoralis]NIA72219.1 ABC transporter permease [Pelagibius litoralis]